ncbi:MAG TPA: DUF6065 family protein [Herpetosiphonaceae bacterium]
MQHSSSAAGKIVDVRAAPVAPEAEAFLSALVVYQSPVAKVRLGTDTDGGYIICDHLGPYDLLLSGGIGGDNSFEIDVIERYGVDCYAFDHSVATVQQHHPRLTFIQKSISPISSEYSSNLKEFLRQSDDILLKLDIEGAEFAWISALATEELLKFKQIVIEVHDLFARDYSESRSFLSKLTANHVLVHVHANNWRGTVNVGGIAVPEVFECTFIRKDCYPSPLIPNQDPIPSALDRPNLATRPDICLRGWPFAPVGREIADEQPRSAITSLHITAYPVSDQAVAITPVPNERAWVMELGAVAADLALSSAGGKGWEVLCPYAVEATWTGGPSPEDIVIRSDMPDEDTPSFVQSVLGHGLLTFYPGYQCKTEAGEALWVRGPINWPKDGLAPLEQILDTAVLPCTVVVQWQFTRPQQTIRFAAGEPFGTLLLTPTLFAETNGDQVTLNIVPVATDVEAYEATLKQIISDPALQSLFLGMGATPLEHAAAAQPPPEQPAPDRWAAQLTAPPPVSCICLTYARPALLEEAIFSFLQQEYAGPKELIVVNDYDQQILEFDHPEVRVINLPRRLRTVGEKMNLAVALASHDLLFVWDDDDIYLPHRIAFSVEQFAPAKGFFKPDEAWFWSQGAVSGPTKNFFHVGSCYTRTLFDAVRGYAAEGSGYDWRFEQRLAQSVPGSTTTYAIQPEDIYYIYRWDGTGSYHMSAFGEYTPDANVGHREVEAYVQRSADAGEILRGRIQLIPQWRHNYGERVAEQLRAAPARSGTIAGADTTVRADVPSP